MNEQLDTRALIFRGHGIVGQLFTSKPRMVALVVSGLALLCLNLPARLLGLGHVWYAHGSDVGFLAKLNWSLFYPLVAPIFIVLGIFTFRKMRDSVYQLIEKSDRRIPVIVNSDGSVADGYPEDLSKVLASCARWISPVAMVMAVTITALDTKDLWPGFFNGGIFAESRVLEWDSAFRLEYPAIVLGGKWANFFFDVIAYGFQTAIVFLGIFFLIKYSTFLWSMSRIINRRRPPYRFEPWTSDLHRRLGLKPLGWVFNLFLVIVVIYQVYCLYHRIEQIDAHSHIHDFSYVKSTWDEMQFMKAEGFFGQVSALLKLPTNPDMWKTLSNPSTWIDLVWMLPPIFVISLLPLGWMFWYLRRELALLTDRTNVELVQAINDKDKLRVEEMEKRLKYLRETSIWPNGSLAGSAFFILMIKLLIGSICPPLLLWGLISGIILKYAWSLLGKPSKP